MIVAFVGASASGKTVISRALVEQYGFQELVSYTTRSPRPGEKDGVDYHFVSDQAFANMVLAEDFVEYEQYTGNRWYGSAKVDVKEAAQSDKLYAMVVTPSGMRSITKLVGKENVMTILVECDLEERVKRYMARCKGKFTLDSLEEINNRAQRDFGMLMGVSKEVDCVIDNTHCELNNVARAIYNDITSHFASIKSKDEENTEQER